MHIAFLTSEYPHPAVRHSAGIGTSIKNLATALVEEGHQVTLFIYGQKKHLTFVEHQINFHLIKQKEYKLGGFYFYRKYVQKFINAHSAQIDVLEAPDWTGITAFMNFKKPLVIRLHGSDTYFCHLENRPQKKKNYLFEKWALKRAKAITSVSVFTAQKTQELFRLKKQITVIHNIILLENFIPLASIAESRYILNFGSVIRKKGVIALGKAFNNLAGNLPDVELKYLGKDIRDALTGTMTSTLILNEIDPCFQKRVSFIEQVPYDEVNQYINKAAVVCLPSYAEAFPMTWLEAMALEKPLVTSNIGWANEIMIDGTTGSTMQPDDSELFFQALKKMLTDKEFAMQCGKNARMHLESNFSKKQIVNQNLSFYKSVIND
ncbi:glycosyltransferase family 4 protein [uncultured Nonlabens sp.]|uniref:glycosyltransferase family 4 protein n=1 Tax=uncultured Nonlabens sp. TaxID=859306 RepID=UPI00260E29D7|nr:glycosyltransferase family 4 protein [uncultured Nonlabens sp.]